MYFKEWFYLYLESAMDDQALSILNNNREAFNQIKSISPEPKYLPLLAKLYLEEPNLNHLKHYVDKFKELVDKKRVNYQIPNKINNEAVNWLKFTEIVDGLIALDKPQEEAKPINGKPIFSNKNVDIYLGEGKDACIQYGSGYSFCIASPRRNLWQTYRDTQTSTFYFVFDKTRPKSDPLHVVVVDMAENKIDLTDADNRTGHTKEFGNDAEKYFNYLKTLGVPTDIFKNVPKSPEEIEDQKLLGKLVFDLDWFKKLSYDQKYKYIGREHVLADEQFDYLFDNKAWDLLNLYVTIIGKLHGHQLKKVLSNNNLAKTYLRERLKNQFTDLNNEEIEKLLEFGLDKFELNRMAIKEIAMYAAKFRNIELFNKVIDKAKNVNEILEDMALYGYYREVESLMDKATDFNNAMANAAQKGRYRIVKLLMNKATDFERAMADAAHHGNLSIVKLLMDEIDNVDHVISDSAWRGNYNIVEFLLDKAKNLNNALINAASRGNEHIAKLLLDKAADKITNFDVAMLGAVRGGHKKIVELLLDKSTNINEAIRYAIKYGHKDIVELLLDKATNLGQAEIDMANRNWNYDIADMIQNHIDKHK